MSEEALEVLGVRSGGQQILIRELINRELARLLDIVTYTLWAIKVNSKENHFSNILENE